MATFTGVTRLRSGYWWAIRNWLLRERRDVPKRLKVIEAELKRIGEVTVVYGGEVDGVTGARQATEHREGISVTSGSSLEKLLQAYIAQGGNPFDISMFLKPDKTRILDTNESDEAIRYELYPQGGVAAPKSRSGPRETDNADSGKQTYGPDPGGYIPLKGYQPARLGGRRSPTQETTLNANRMRKIRQWADPSIRERLKLLEHRIVKLCDLREQLEQERDRMLAQAWGGVFPDFDAQWVNVTSGGNLDQGQTFVKNHRVQSLMDSLDQIFGYKQEDGSVFSDVPNQAEIRNQTWAYEDDPEGTEQVLGLKN